MSKWKYLVIKPQGYVPLQQPISQCYHVNNTSLIVKLGQNVCVEVIGQPAAIITSTYQMHKNQNTFTVLHYDDDNVKKLIDTTGLHDCLIDTECGKVLCLFHYSNSSEQTKQTS